MVVKKGVKLESYVFASKMFIFASIFKNSELRKADLSYKSPQVFKFYLCLIRTAQYCSENERPKKSEPKLESYGFASKMLIFASIFKNSKLPRVELSYKSSNMFNFYLCLIWAAQYGSEN